MIIKIVSIIIVSIVATIALAADRAFVQHYVCASLARDPGTSTLHDNVKVSKNGNGHFTLLPNTKFYAEHAQIDAMQGARLLIRQIEPATGFRYRVKQTFSKKSIANSFLYTTTNVDENIVGEGFRLDVTPRSVVIRARNINGFKAGTECLRQLFPARIYEQKPQGNVPWKLPSISIVVTS